MRSSFNGASIVSLFLCVACALPPKVKNPPSISNKISISYRFLQTTTYQQEKNGPHTDICYYDTYDPSVHKMPAKFKEALERSAYIESAHTVKLEKPLCLAIRNPLNPPVPSPAQFSGRTDDFYIDYIMHTGAWMVDEDSLNAWTFVRAFASILTLTIIPYSEKMRMRVLAVVYDKNLNFVGTYFQYTKASFHLWLPYLFHPKAKSVFSYGLKSPVIDKTLNELFKKMSKDIDFNSREYSYLK